MTQTRLIAFPFAAITLAASRRDGTFMKITKLDVILTATEEYPKRLKLLAEAISSIVAKGQIGMQCPC